MQFSTLGVFCVAETVVPRWFELQNSENATLLRDNLRLVQRCSNEMCPNSHHTPCVFSGNQILCGIERHTVMHLRRYLQPWAVVLEIGARFGTVSCAISKLQRQSGLRVSLEIEGRAFAALQQNTASNRCRGVQLQGAASTIPLFQPVRPAWDRVRQAGSEPSYTLGHHYTCMLHPYHTHTQKRFARAVGPWLWWVPISSDGSHTDPIHSTGPSIPIPYRSHTHASLLATAISRATAIAQHARPCARTEPHSWRKSSVCTPAAVSISTHWSSTARVAFGAFSVRNRISCEIRGSSTYSTKRTRSRSSR
jgi:hypothetical protein